MTHPSVISVRPSDYRLNQSTIVSPTVAQNPQLLDHLEQHLVLLLTLLNTVIVFVLSREPTEHFTKLLSSVVREQVAPYDQVYEQPVENAAI